MHFTVFYLKLGVLQPLAKPSISYSILIVLFYLRILIICAQILFIDSQFRFSNRGPIIVWADRFNQQCWVHILQSNFIHRRKKWKFI